MGKKAKLWLLGLGGAVVAAGTAFQLMRHRYEEPEHDTVATFGPLSIRRYAPRVVAETVVEGSEGEVTSEGFRRLAGYIFGGNRGDARIDMTTPVERSPGGVRIDMTTPVERAPAREGWTVTFTMPREHSLESLPAPTDPRVELRELPAETVAVLRFSGRADVETRRAKTEELLRRLGEHGYEAAGEPRLAQYDPPWVLGPFRRNEIHVPVRERG